MEEVCHKFYPAVAVSPTAHLYAKDAAAAFGLTEEQVGDAANMNGKPGQYQIANSNPSSKEAFSTDYNAEYFEVSSPLIKTRYSEVFWTMMEAVPLPTDIVQRFANGKVMAIVGYEADQVRQTPSGEESVPITWTYNHHYMAYIHNAKKAAMVRTSDPSEVLMGKDHGSDMHWVVKPLDKESSSGFPISTVFSEGNGGEYRMSFHGYPKGYAQLIESPTVFQISPMQIDTWNREMTDGKFKPGPLPRSSKAPLDQGYSGLLECPCSDRLSKVFGPRYALEGAPQCEGPVGSAVACFSAARQVIPAGHYTEHPTADASKPRGCSAIQHTDGSVEAFWNAGKGGDAIASREGTPSRLVAFSQAEVNVTVSLSRAEAADAVTVTLVGPADRWFGVGFGASGMCVHMTADECEDGGPYTIVVAGDGQEGVTERKLDFHGPGTLLAASVKVESSSVVDGNRTVVLTRSLKGASASHFTFDPSAATMPIIAARGCHLAFAQHCGHGPSRLNFVAAETLTSVCFAGIAGSIGGNAFHKNCAPYPVSDLAVQLNPTCNVTSYVGGLTCCRHQLSLLDKNQAVPWPDQFLEFRLKFRFYFEEFVPAPTPSHQLLVRLYTQTEAFAGEYDIVQCPPGTPSSQCVQVITSRRRVQDLLSGCSTTTSPWCTGIGSNDPAKTAGIKLIYAGPHCHAPTCLSMELYNADTGALLCRVEPLAGRGGPDPYDEERFLAIPPCLWGSSAEGLPEPVLLPLHTTILSIKRSNSTWGHTGDMASWQMRGVVVPKQAARTGPEPEPVVLRVADDRSM